jgi:hypothetical protein
MVAAVVSGRSGRDIGGYGNDVCIRGCNPASELGSRRGPAACPPASLAPCISNYTLAATIRPPAPTTIPLHPHAQWPREKPSRPCALYSMLLRPKPAGCNASKPLATRQEHLQRLPHGPAASQDQYNTRPGALPHMQPASSWVKRACMSFTASTAPSLCPLADT